MAVFENPVISKQIGCALVTVFGNQPTLRSGADAFATVIETAVSLGADRNQICILNPPGNPGDRGFKKVLRPKFKTGYVQPRLQAEGTWITKPKQAIILPSRDCIAACLVCLITGAVALGHSGREASRPVKIPGDKPPSIITLLRQIAPWYKREQVMAFLSSSICPDCFGHDTEHGQELVKDFADLGEGELLLGDPADGKLRMLACNYMYLLGHGIAKKHILIDDTCTNCSPAFGSYRHGDKTDNYTFLIKQS